MTSKASEANLAYVRLTTRNGPLIGGSVTRGARGQRHERMVCRHTHRVDGADARLTEALGRARSGQWLERCAAAGALAEFVGDGRADVAIRSLLGDLDDTAPTQAMAAALMKRRDDASLALLVEALSVVDDDSGQWIYDEIWMSRQSPSDKAELRAQLSRLAATATPSVATEIEQLLVNSLH
jgi:hypothetical protein